MVSTLSVLLWKKRIKYLRLLLFNHHGQTWRHGKVPQPSEDLWKTNLGSQCQLFSKCTFVKKFVPVHSGVSNFEKKLKPLIKTLKKNLAWSRTPLGGWVMRGDCMNRYAQLFGGIKRSRHQNVLVIRESSGGGHGKNGKKDLLHHLFPPHWWGWTNKQWRLDITEDGPVCVCLVLRTGNVWIITFIIYIYFSPFSGDLAFDKCLLKID